MGGEVVAVGATASFIPGIPLEGTFSISTDGEARFFSIEEAGFDSRSGINSAVIRSAVVFDWDPANAQRRRYTFPVFFMAEGATAQISVQVSTCQ